MGGILPRDLDIRQTLRSAKHREHAGDDTTLILDEMVLCQGEARVDVAIVNGALEGYEIKSERDSLSRLAGQARVYSRVFDFMTIVCGPIHLEHMSELVPDWWGIVSASGSAGAVSLNKIRDAIRNPNPDPAAQIQLLWREEALDELAARGMSKGMLSKPRAVLWQRLVDQLERDVISEIVRTRLKRRRYPRVVEQSQ